MKVLVKLFFLTMMVAVTQIVAAQDIFVTEGETVVYRVWLDKSIQGGTVSDALQNVPGVRVEVDGAISLRGVSHVEIFINDQPSHFSQDARKNYLQQTSAADIKEIMVMANPSARYTTASNTGIINIMTKEEKNQSHALSLGFRANTIGDYSPWVSYSYNKEKFSFTANVRGTYNKEDSNTKSYGYVFDEDNNDDTLNIERNYKHTQDLKLGLNYDFQFNYKFDSKNSIKFYLTGEIDDQESKYYDSTYRKDADEYQYITNKDYDYWGWDARQGITYQHDFNDKGHALSLSFNTVWMPGKSTAISKRYFNVGDVDDRTTREINDYSDFHWNAKAEYTLPYSEKGELYIALMKTHKPDGNKLLFDTIADGQYVRDTLRTEIRNYYTDKNELLINLQHSFGRFTVKPGIDFDYTVMTANFPDEHWYDFEKYFFTVHPSFYVTYSTAKQHNFSIGYTHKTDYPFVRKFSKRILYQEDSFDVGNPDLKPASTHVVKAEWTKYWEKFGSVGINAYYKGSSNYINDVQYSEYSEIYGRYVTYNKPVNLGGYSDAGCELNLTYRPSAMLNARFYANLFNSHLEYPVSEDEVVKSDMFCYNLTMNIWTKLWKRLELYASAYYNSKKQALYSYTQTPYGIDCGMKIDFFKNRMSVLVNVNDLFDWNRTDNSINQPTYEYYSTEKTESRHVSVEVIFKII